MKQIVSHSVSLTNQSMKYFSYILILAAALFCSACKHSYTVPQSAEKLNQTVRIFPDYTDIVIPPNIAPLNFMVRAEGDEFMAEYKMGSETKLVAGGGKDGIIEFDQNEWHKTVGAAKGKSFKVTVYVKKNGIWKSFNPFNVQVAEEPIDSFLSYRLIEPGYEIYRQMGLYQRNVTNFDVHVIYENNRTYSETNSHCVNCHNYQNYSTKRMLFHVRANHGGTVIAENGKVEKINPKTDSTLSNAVYPSWHPRRNWLVFSSNKTGQIFHISDKQRVEVLDYGSDLIFYNADTHEISNVLKTPTEMETFPCWNPGGTRVYYCEGPQPPSDALNDTIKVNELVSIYKHLKYNLMSIPFDEKTMTFGKPQMELDCRAMGKSASVPRVSPDGKFVLFTLGNFGQFHIWHTSSDLWVKNLGNGQCYPLRAANSRNVDSYHSWSSNGRWIAFSSRRDDGDFTRTYMTYFDKNGQSHKAFMLPQKDPTFNLRLFKSFNVPEMTKDAVTVPAKKFKEVIYNTPGLPVKYKELRPGHKK